MHREDTFIKRCKRRVESIKERDLWVDGEFMSEEDMTAAGNSWYEVEIRLHLS